MSEKINSFTETVNRFIKDANYALEFAVKTNETLTTQDDYVQMTVTNPDPVTGDPSIVTYSIPSYYTMMNKVNATVNSVDTFVNGTGKILLADGTYREIKTTPVAISPKKITEVVIPTSFKTKNNWFFEDLMFPQLAVSFDLKDKIEDSADRVSVKRVIFDNSSDGETQWFKDNIVGENRSYYDTILLLNENDKTYWEDDQIVDLPLFTESYTGYFLIIDKRTIDGKEWYYLDTLNYGIPSDSPVIKNLQLSKGSLLRYNNTIYKIENIEVSEKRVDITNLIGVEKPSISYSFEIYSEPFSSKITDIAVGYNECDIIFLKGINEKYNLLGDNWSNGIPFYTNDLIFKNSSLTLADYYNQYVSDFGKIIEGQAKERYIPAYYGVDPNSPNLRESSFKVVQINTQVNAALDTDEIKNSQTQIESTKTIINSLKSTIAQQKAELVTITNPAQREDLNSKIAINVNDLAKRTVEYQSLVRSLATLAYESNAVNTSPKYRLRGFFDIPSDKKNFESSTSEKAQEIIQFEISYRYLKLDNTGVNLTTFEQTDPSTGKVKKGVFSDWNNINTPIKERVYDTSLNMYKWVQPDTADGDVVNINQVDIPISKGEKVEFRVRSISEAGWPTNPRKSNWSDSLIIDFPPNLSGSNQVTNILNDAVEEESNIQLQETLNASGITTHIADSIPNPNAGDGTYFKHQSINLAYDLSKKDADGVTQTTSVTNLQTQLNNLPSYTYITLSNPGGGNETRTRRQLTGTLQQLFQAIVNVDPSIYDEFGDYLPNA